MIKQYYLIYTECNKNVGQFIFEEDEKELCQEIAIRMLKMKKIHDVKILESKILETSSLREVL